jgi:hypothetical protein
MSTTDGDRARDLSRLTLKQIAATDTGVRTDFRVKKNNRTLERQKDIEKVKAHTLHLLPKTIQVSHLNANSVALAQE